MRANILTRREVFTPVKIELIIEDEEELKELYHRFNIGSSTVKEESDVYSTWNPKNSDVTKVWETFEKLLVEYNLEP